MDALLNVWCVLSIYYYKFICLYVTNQQNLGCSGSNRRNGNAPRNLKLCVVYNKIRFDRKLDVQKMKGVDWVTWVEQTGTYKVNGLCWFWKELNINPKQSHRLLGGPAMSCMTLNDRRNKLQSQSKNNCIISFNFDRFILVHCRGADSQYSIIESIEEKMFTYFVKRPFGSIPFQWKKFFRLFFCPMKKHTFLIDFPPTKSKDKCITECYDCVKDLSCYVRSMATLLHFSYWWRGIPAF